MYASDETQVRMVPLPASGELNLTSAPSYSIVVTSAVSKAASLVTAVTSPALRSTTAADELTEVHHATSHVLAYSFISIGVLAFLALVAFVAICIFRRNKLDRIRHHLMPMYNFDATDEEARWEADLLEDDREQQIALNSVAGQHGRPKLKFHSHGLDV